MTGSLEATRPSETNDTLHLMVTAAQQAGRRLEALFDPAARPQDWAALRAAVQRNEDASLPQLRNDLTAARPDVGWVGEDLEAAVLPSGDFWVVDAVEGNVNHVHGMADWGVSVTLIRDNEPMLAVVHQPIGGLTYTAVRGGGATLNGQPLRVSAKSDVSAALAVTGQAEAGQTDTYASLGRSYNVMLQRALLVRAAVPSTFPLLAVAAGHVDVFWQFGAVLPGIAAGSLMVTEAGGTVTDLEGQPWRPGARQVLAAAPALHADALETLCGAA